jgi:hypothetical protein
VGYKYSIMSLRTSGFNLNERLGSLAFTSSAEHRLPLAHCLGRIDSALWARELWKHPGLSAASFGVGVGVGIAVFAPYVDEWELPDLWTALRVPGPPLSVHLFWRCDLLGVLIHRYYPAAA